IALARELTKKFEEIVRGSVSQCLQYIQEHPPQGEYVIVVEGGKASEIREEESWWGDLTLTEHVEHYLTQDKGRTPKEAMRYVAAERGMSRREVYNQFEAEKKA